MLEIEVSDAPPVAVFRLALPLPIEDNSVLRIVMRFNRDEVVLGPLRDGDTLALIGGLAPWSVKPVVQYSGTVIHPQAQVADKCGVRCDGGDLVVDQCCATCTKNGITLKVCC
jgi:hypothetical protein